MDIIALENLRVMVVDDKKFIRETIGRVLNQLGIQDIVFASSGSEAIALLDTAQETIDVVFTDLQMANGDGVEFSRRVTELDHRPAITFISGSNRNLLMTAESVARARGLQVLGVLEKPVGLADIKRALNQLAKPQPKPQSTSTSVITKTDLEQAIKHGELFLHFQPKANILTHKIVGFESLVRWLHPVHGLISPLEFIALAEKNGLITQVTDRVCELALAQCARWKRAGLDIKVSVNMSALMLNDLSLPDRLAEQVLGGNIDPGQIVLEVTESGIFENEADSLDILARLNLKGFQLSIDDFGTGYSSLDQLQRVPFAELKIDRVFVSGAADSIKKRAILESSASLGRKLGMTVVAEGAETEDDLRLLAELGVCIVQGYAIGKPMPPGAVLSWIEGWQVRSDIK